MSHYWIKMEGLAPSTFAVWPWQRCRARTKKTAGRPYWGRCDLRKNHDTMHALERGFDVVWFS